MNDIAHAKYIAVKSIVASSAQVIEEFCERIAERTEMGHQGKRYELSMDELMARPTKPEKCCNIGLAYFGW